VIIVRETLRHPLRHTLLVFAMMTVIMSVGVAVGVFIRHMMPGTGMPHFLVECTLWLVMVALLSSPLSSKMLRRRLLEAIPR
jgi:hypothetical protein